MSDILAEALGNDPDGVLDELFIGPQLAPEPTLPNPSDSDVWAQMLRDLTEGSWNEAIQATREAEGEGWTLDLSNKEFYNENLEGRDLIGVDFSGARLEHCSLNYANLSNTVFDRFAYVYASTFSHAQLRGSKLRDAGGIEFAKHLDRAYNYSPPLRDVTQEVARHFLQEAIGDSESFIHDGLDELRADGFKLFWVGDKLKFYLNYEMQKYRDLCKEDECDCDVDHCCMGECSCCSCHTNSCDCQKDHSHDENVPTEEWYLATIVGHVEFQWNSALGLIGNIVMDSKSHHPHVSTNGSICWGNMEMPRTIRPIDYFIAMMGWVGQHNPSDPYREMYDLPRIR